MSKANVKDRELDHLEVGVKDEDPDFCKAGGQSLPQDEQWHAAEKRLTRKLDFTLVPLLWVLYLFNYLDRTNIAYVRYCLGRDVAG